MFRGDSEEVRIQIFPCSEKYPDIAFVSKTTSLILSLDPARTPCCGSLNILLEARKLPFSFTEEVYIPGKQEG